MNESQVMKFYEKISEMSERIARMETMLTDNKEESRRITDMLKDHDLRISELEEKSAKMFGVREFIAWGIAIAIGIAGVVIR